MAELENNVIVQDDDIYNKTIKTIVAPERKKDIDLDKTLYDNIIQAGINSTLDLTSLNSLNQTLSVLLALNLCVSLMFVFSITLVFIASKSV